MLFHVCQPDFILTTSSCYMLSDSNAYYPRHTQAIEHIILIKHNLLLSHKILLEFYIAIIILTIVTCDVPES